MNRTGCTQPERVVLRELSLRDGLQQTSVWPTTEQKRAVIKRAHAAGVRHFEVGSFLPTSRFPQFADVRALVDAVATLPGAVPSALAMNERAVRDALATPVGEMVVSLSATEAHNQANIRRSREEAIRLLRHAAEACRAARHRPRVIAALSMAFGCSIAGEVDPGEVERLAVACRDAGADAIAIADTVGYAGPSQVASLTARIIAALEGTPVIVHLHDTRGMGIANAAAALAAGVRTLDGTLGGLGGCPFAPGATGNVAFEDLVYLCERSGYTTGIDLAGVIEARQLLGDSIPGEPLHGALARAGAPANIRWDAKRRPRAESPGNLPASRDLPEGRAG